MYEVERDNLFKQVVLPKSPMDLHTEMFSDESSMFKFMDQLRQSSQNECVGCVDKVGSQYFFGYMFTDDPVMTRFVDAGQRSWHSHPNLSAEELASVGKLDSSDMQGLSYFAKRAAKAVEAVFAAAEIPSPNKPSILDLVNYIYHRREADLISMPPSHLLELTRLQTDKQLPIDSLNREFQFIGLKYGVSGLISKAISPLFKELVAVNTMLYYASLAKALHKEIQKMGYEKLTENNFLQVVDALGFDFRYLKIGDTGT